MTDPKHARVGGDRCCGVEVGPVARPPEPGPEIVELHLDPVAGDVIARSVPHIPEGDGLCGVVTGVTIPDLADVSSGGQLVFGELSDRFQQPVAGGSGRLLRGDQ